MYKKTSSVTAVILGIFMFLGFVPLAIGLYNYSKNIDASDSAKAEALSLVGTGATIVIACLLGLTLCEIAANIAAIRAAAERPMAPPNAPYPPQQPANTPYSAPEAKTDSSYSNQKQVPIDRLLGIQTKKPKVVFTCPGCKEKTTIEKDKITIGSETSCPHCGKVIKFKE